MRDKSDLIVLMTIYEESVKTAEYFYRLCYDPQASRLVVGHYFSPGMYDRPDEAGYNRVEPLSEYLTRQPQSREKVSAFFDALSEKRH